MQGCAGWLDGGLRLFGVQLLGQSVIFRVGDARGPWTGGASVTGHFFDRSGTVVATTSYECFIRVFRS
ncbi:hypothetical protein [Rhodococcus phenolicus]|uniref:hypothetical protein n=1 Tax=Rhodococcus phenolicus TaxID=263849 RepID=UPI000832C224|nr:hypothetical protein [Rhodococcus phenolicus]